MPHNMKPYQFDLRSHYSVMTELDREVHEDAVLAAAEVGMALRSLAAIPARVFLPCVGTGRHIPALLQAGVTRIVGVDLSADCLEQARRRHAGDARVELLCADLLDWQPADPFDATLLLGNSFGDLIDPAHNRRFAQSLVRSLHPRGQIIFDYIGTGYLERCRDRTPSRWNSELHGQPIHDTRTPRFDAASRVMTIDVLASHAATNEPLWRGAYQKLILDDDEVRLLFAEMGIALRPIGKAIDINPHYRATDPSTLGMLACSTWWRSRAPSVIAAVRERECVAARPLPGN